MTPSRSLSNRLSRATLHSPTSCFLFIADTLAKSYTFTFDGFPLSLVIISVASTFGLANFHLHFASFRPAGVRHFRDKSKTYIEVSLPSFEEQKTVYKDFQY